MIFFDTLTPLINYVYLQQVERQDTQIRELLHSVSELEKKHSFLPRKKKDNEPPPPPPPVPPLILPATPLVTGPPKGVQSRDEQATSTSQDPLPNRGTRSSMTVQSLYNTSVISGAMTILEREFLPEKPARFENGLVMQAIEYAQNKLLRHQQLQHGAY